MPYVDLAFILCDTGLVGACLWFLPRQPAHAYLWQALAAAATGQLTKAAIQSIFPGSPFAHLASVAGIALAAAALWRYRHQGASRVAESGPGAPTV